MGPQQNASFFCGHFQRKLQEIEGSKDYQTTGVGAQKRLGDQNLLALDYELCASLYLTPGVKKTGWPVSSHVASNVLSTNWSNYPCAGTELFYLKAHETLRCPRKFGTLLKAEFLQKY
jgi:hypothetical protein